MQFDTEMQWAERAECSDALNTYAADRAHALRSALDRAYQAQQLDMLGAYEAFTEFTRKPRKNIKPEIGMRKN